MANKLELTIRTSYSNMIIFVKAVEVMEKIFDVAIIGGGPAGLSAAVTASIRNKNVIIFLYYCNIILASIY